MKNRFAAVVGAVLFLAPSFVQACPDLSGKWAMFFPGTQEFLVTQIRQDQCRSISAIGLLGGGPDEVRTLPMDGIFRQYSNTAYSAVYESNALQITALESRNESGHFRLRSTYSRIRREPDGSLKLFAQSYNSEGQLTDTLEMYGYKQE